MKHNKILVPVDFSEYSDTAFQYALTLAGQLNAEITLVHVNVLYHTVLPEANFSIHEFQSSVRESIDEIKTKIEPLSAQAEARGVGFDYAILRANTVAEPILDFIRENEFDFLVMGTHGRTGLRHMLLGSIAEKVVRFSPIPVITLHKNVDECRVKNLLVPVDFSDYSKLAVDFAVKFSQLLGAKITVMHVVERVVYPAFYPEGVYPLLDYEPHFHTQVVDNIQKLFDKQFPFEVKKEVAAGRPSDEIVKFAAENEIDLIIMATKGLSGLEHLIVGSTTERVVRRSPVPVLTLRKPEDFPAQPEAN